MVCALIQLPIKCMQRMHLMCVKSILIQVLSSALVLGIVCVLNVCVLWGFVIGMVHVAGGVIDSDKRLEWGEDHTNRWISVTSVICTADGKQLYVTDRLNHVVRCVNPHTHKVTTIAACRISEDDCEHKSEACLHRCEALVFDRNALVPESAMFVTAKNGIRRISLPLGMCMCCLFLVRSQTAAAADLS